MPHKDLETRRVYEKRFYDKRRSMAISLLGGKCVKCGTADNLEFDHIEPSTKSFNVTSELSTTLEKLITELGKCQLLCEKCHIAKTASECKKPISHGTVTGYRRKCRCKDCKAAHAAAEYKRRHNLPFDTPRE